MPSNPNLETDSQAVKTRVSNVNEYVLDLENVYLERTMHATAIKTLIALIKYVQVPPNLPFTNEKNFNKTFSEVFLCGKIGVTDIDKCIGGTPIDNDIGPPDIMTGNTYNDRLDEIGTAADTFNVDTTLTVKTLTVNEDYGVHVYQENPWFVIVEANVTISVVSETAKWDKEITVKTEIGIENFDDPYYLVNTEGDYENKISNSSTMPGAWDVNEVIAFIRHGNYTHFDNEQGPSFLMRFIDEAYINDPTPPDLGRIDHYNNLRECCGIESLVYPDHPSISDKDVSYVDYKYWKPAEDCDNPSYNIYTVNGISDDVEFDKFKLGEDDVDIDRYNLEDDAVLECP